VGRKDERTACLVTTVQRCDPYEPGVRWLKIKNPDYSQKEGRGDLFNGPRQRTAYPAGWR
jgi:hypothetical protein